MNITIFEPELNFLPFACEACGARVATEADLDLHKKETCERRWQNHCARSSIFGSEGPGGVADGGRRT